MDAPSVGSPVKRHDGPAREHALEVAFKGSTPCREWRPRSIPFYTGLVVANSIPFGKGLMPAKSSLFASPHVLRAHLGRGGCPPYVWWSYRDQDNCTSSRQKGKI